MKYIPVIHILLLCGIRGALASVLGEGYVEGNIKK